MAEVLVFLVAGPWLLAKPGSAKAAGLSAVAGVVRWAIIGYDHLDAGAGRRAGLHGLTFARLRLAPMGIIAQHAPERLAATAQTIYGTFALGIASALLTLASGYLYGWFGMHAFWVMTALCTAALPLVAGLGRGREERDRATFRSRITSLVPALCQLLTPLRAAVRIF